MVPWEKVKYVSLIISRLLSVIASILQQVSYPVPINNLGLTLVIYLAGWKRRFDCFKEIHNKYGFSKENYIFCIVTDVWKDTFK